MGAFEAIAMIGASYVLISLYRVLSHIERSYQAVWHGSEKYRRSRVGKSRAKPAKNLRFRRGKSANIRRSRQRRGTIFVKRTTQRF